MTGFGKPVKKAEISLTNIHVSPVSYLWDTGKQYSPRCDASECSVPSEAFLFA